MLLLLERWLLGLGGEDSKDPLTGCCGRGIRAPCARGGGDIHEYSPNTQIPGVLVLEEPDPILQGCLPRGPAERTVPTYVAAGAEVLQGEALHSGTLLRLQVGRPAAEVHMAVHVNGFSFTIVAEAGDNRTSCERRLWSPFCLIENCDIKGSLTSSKLALFSLTFFQKREQDEVYHFASSGSDAAEQRSRWTRNIAEALGDVTASLFPLHAIATQPVPGKAATSTRIMAGYLLLQTGVAGMVSVFYCELQAYRNGKAQLALYKDEWCEQQVTNIPVVDTVMLGSCDGIHCTVFAVEHQRFCARSRSERDLWLRAVTNVKVKLMFEAPDPTEEELAVFRDAVDERLESLGGPWSCQARPLLDEVPRLPPRCPLGDSRDPEPPPADEDSRLFVYSGVDESDTVEVPSRDVTKIPL